MGKFFYVIFIFLFLVSCAQIGVLTGGETDEYPPRIIRSSIPPFALNTTPKQIILYFDEYYQLNKPEETIKLIPEDAKITATVKKKSLILTLDGDLFNHTTYSIFMDGSIKDITEGNDSIYRWVFSTGNHLDSNSQSILVKDAYKGTLEKGVSVGLFDSLSATKPRYITQTDLNGFAKWEYVAEGAYFMKVFNDISKNSEIDFFELQDQLFEARNLSLSDTLTFELSLPRPEVIKNYKYVSPDCIYAYVPEKYKFSDFTLNGIQLSLNQFKRVARDSAIFYLPESSDLDWVLNTNNDTFRFTRPINFKEEILTPTLSVSGVQKNNRIDLKVNGLIRSIAKIEDWNLIQVLDSTEIQIDSIGFSQSLISVYFQTPTLNALKLKIPGNGILGINSNTNKPTILDLVYAGNKELGSLTISLEKSMKNAIVILEKDGKEIDRRILVDANEVFFTSLLPGDYKAVLIDDVNGNGYWDPINLNLKQRAEKTQRFSKLPKVRANWDIKATLNN